MSYLSIVQLENLVARPLSKKDPSHTNFVHQQQHRWAFFSFTYRQSTQPNLGPKGV